MRALIWSNIFTLVPLVCYAMQAGIDFSENRMGYGIMFLCYSGANVGIMIGRYH